MQTTTRLLPHARPIPLPAILALVALLAGMNARAADERDLYGNYRIADSVCPGQCARSAAAMAAWHGRAAGYTPDYAYLDEHACATPDYVARELDAPAMTAEFGIPPERLGLEAADDLTLINVRCGGTVWAEPGSVVLLAGARRYAVWDGMFFGLVEDTPPPPPPF